LRREVRKSDTVARLAGDEFTVILEELHDRADAEKVAAGILKAVNMPLRLAEQEIQITSSIGIALYEGESVGSNELLDRADIALYAVKRAGRNACVIYSAEIDTRGMREAAVEVTCMSGTWKQG
jgi:diguanylate cyclase (GGDEF)-like protein